MILSMLIMGVAFNKMCQSAPALKNVDLDRDWPAYVSAREQCNERKRCLVLFQLLPDGKYFSVCDEPGEPVDVFAGEGFDE